MSTIILSQIGGTSGLVKLRTQDNGDGTQTLLTLADGTPAAAPVYPAAGPAQFSATATPLTPGSAYAAGTLLGAKLTFAGVFRAATERAWLQGVLVSMRSLQSAPLRLVLRASDYSGSTIFTDRAQWGYAPGDSPDAVVDLTSYAQLSPAGTTMLTAVAIAGGGAGYTAGDVLTVAGGAGTAATVTVLTVDGSGAILTAAVQTSGYYTANPASPNASTGGTGAGASLTLTLGAAAQTDYYVGNLGIPLAGGSTSLFGALLANGSITPNSRAGFGVKLLVSQE